MVATEASPNSETNLEVIVRPERPLTTNWAIVMDTSHSMRGVFDSAFGAYLKATSFPTDQLNFCLITFNNQSMEQFKDWSPASVDEFKKAGELIERENRRGVLSYGAKAIRMALQQERQELTVLIITDGGFTEACNRRGFGSIRQVFIENQEWRKNRELGEALISCIGIQNTKYTTGGKPPDEECQAFLQEVGTRWGGGYFFVREN